MKPFGSLLALRRALRPRVVCPGCGRAVRLLGARGTVIPPHPTVPVRANADGVANNAPPCPAGCTRLPPCGALTIDAATRGGKVRG